MRAQNSPFRAALGAIVCDCPQAVAKKSKSVELQNPPSDTVRDVGLPICLWTAVSQCSDSCLLTLPHFGPFILLPLATSSSYFCPGPVEYSLLLKEAFITKKSVLHKELTLVGVWLFSHP